jgi:hypothetical protein
MPRKLQVKPHSTRILDYSSTMSQYEIESLAAEATLNAEKKAKEGNKRHNRPSKRKAAYIQTVPPKRLRTLQHDGRRYLESK